MTYGALLFEAPIELRRTVRKIEDTSKKLISKKWSITFNNVCLKENILPNYNRIYIHSIYTHVYL